MSKMVWLPVLVLIVEVACAAVLIWYGWAAKNDRIAPNYILGLRTKKTLSDPEKWYKGNRFTGKVSMVVGAIIAGASVIGIIFILFGRDPVTIMLRVLFFNFFAILAFVASVLLYERYNL